MKATFKFNGYKVTVSGKRMYVTYKQGTACGSVLNDMKALARALGLTLVESYNRKTLITVR